MDFRFKNRGIDLNVYSDEHTGVGFHTQLRSGENADTKVTASHFPRDTESDSAQSHGPREEFYSLNVEQITHGATESGDFSLKTRSSDGVTVYMDRATLEAIHFAAGELLAQSEGIEDNAASGTVNVQVEREKAEA